MSLCRLFAPTAPLINGIIITGCILVLLTTLSVAWVPPVVTDPDNESSRHIFGAFCNVRARVCCNAAQYLGKGGMCMVDFCTNWYRRLYHCAHYGALIRYCQTLHCVLSSSVHSGSDVVVHPWLLAVFWGPLCEGVAGLPSVHQAGAQGKGVDRCVCTVLCCVV